MSNDRTTPGTSFWVTAAVIAVLAYPGSLGPCCWASSRTGIGVHVVEFIYGPILRAADACSMPAVDFFQRYSRLGAPQEWEWFKWPNVNGTGAAWYWKALRWPPFRPGPVSMTRGPSAESDAEEEPADSVRDDDDE